MALERFAGTELALAEGETILENAAREPEIPDLARLLTTMGARIEGAGTSTIRIEGVPSLQGAEHDVIPDRIATGTFLVAGAITGGDLLLEGAEPGHLLAVIDKLAECGVEVRKEPGGLRVTGNGRIKAADVATEEYPGFPTDMQAQFMAMNTVAEGAASVTETIFENRFMHVQELRRLGAQIDVEGNTCMVRGVDRLEGATVMATDLRASACLVIAGLVAQGETVIDRIYHLDRGYEHIEAKLSQLGANIRRLK